MAVACPECGGPTRVVNSRSSSSDVRALSTGAGRHAARAVGWYTPDWVGRERRCGMCNHRYCTVEISIEDLNTGWSRRDE
jgi:transcriptional regulator NrdR family protein